MRIEIRGRNVEVDDELEALVKKRFSRVGRQVSEFATLEVEISEEPNPSIADNQIAEATLRLKGVTLHAREASPGADPQRPRTGRGHAPPGQEASREAPQAQPDAQTRQQDAGPPPGVVGLRRSSPAGQYSYPRVDGQRSGHGHARAARG